MIKVVVPARAVVQMKRPRLNPVLVVDEENEFLPPVGDEHALAANPDQPNWDTDSASDKDTKPGHTVLHSANWTDATIPRLR